MRRYSKEATTTGTASKHISKTFEVCIEIFIAFHNLIRLYAKDSSDITTEHIFHVLAKFLEPHHTWFLLRFEIKCVTYLCLKKNHFCFERHISYSHSRAVRRGYLSSQVYLNLCRLREKRKMTVRNLRVAESAKSIRRKFICLNFSFHSSTNKKKKTSSNSA